jgi:hypothetical protein
MAKTKGLPPKNLTGQMPVSSLDSPWWDQVAYLFSCDPENAGKVLTIEEIAERVSRYPNGRKARGRTCARRLKHVLELVSRGPNGSLGRGATYRVVPVQPTPATGRRDTVDEEIQPAQDWILKQIEKMTED